MFLLISWDICFAFALGIAAIIALVFDLPHTVFVALYFMLGAYVIVGIINDEENM